MAASPLTFTERTRALFRSKDFIRLLKYASTSAVTTVLSLVLLYFFYRVVKVGSGSAAIANVCATVITTIPSYYLNRFWTWGKSGRSHLWREVVPFWAIAFISLVLSTGAVWLAAHNAHFITSSKRGQTFLVEAANFFTYALLWVAKFAIFNKVLFKNEPKDPDGGIDGLPVTVARS